MDLVDTVLRDARWSAHRDTPAETHLSEVEWADLRLYPVLVEYTSSAAAESIRLCVLAVFEQLPWRAVESDEPSSSGLRARKRGPSVHRTVSAGARIESSDDYAAVPAPAPEPALRGAPVAPVSIRKGARMSFSHRVLLWTWDAQLESRLRRQLTSARAFAVIGDIFELRRAMSTRARGAAPMVVLDRRWVLDEEPVLIEPADLVGCDVVVWGGSALAYAALEPALSRVGRLTKCSEHAALDLVTEICQDLLGSA